jgi:hypothetical protein
MSAQWSKWWWLKIYSISTWSPDERRAAGAIWGTFLVAFLLVASVFVVSISTLKFDPKVASVGAIAVSLLIVAPGMRGLASNFFPNTIKRGDEAAAKRTGGTVFLPEESPGLWWLTSDGIGPYSREERFIALMIFLIAMLIFCPTALYFPPRLMAWFDLSKRTAILSIMLTVGPLSYFIGRRLSTWLWPDATRTAHENAWARFNRRKGMPQS